MFAANCSLSPGPGAGPMRRNRGALHLPVSRTERGAGRRLSKVADAVQLPWGRKERGAGCRARTPPLGGARVGSRVFLVVSAIAALLSLQPASAAPNDALYDALAAGDTSPARIARLLSYAEAGDGQAAEVAAFLFATGRPERELVKAFHWYLRAALAGQPDAMDNAVRVWRSMTRDQQRQAENVLANSFTTAQIADLTALWAISYARIPADHQTKTAGPRAHPPAKKH